MSFLRIEKVINELPVVLQPNTMYLLKKGSTVSMHMSDNNGQIVYKVINDDDEIEPFLMAGMANV